jgi:hypothetical protein
VGCWSIAKPLTVKYELSRYVKDAKGRPLYSELPVTDVGPTQRTSRGSAETRENDHGGADLEPSTRWARIAKRAGFHWDRATAALGLRPTRIRFPVPGAECSMSFISEIHAPAELTITEAVILAGRPNVVDPEGVVKSEAEKEEMAPHTFGGISFDYVGGGLPRPTCTSWTSRMGHSVVLKLT